MSGVFRRFWAWPSELRRAGVLGINARNLEVLSECNPRRRFALADDKVLTKGICEREGIPVPRTYGVIRRYGDVRHYAEIVQGIDAFVVKPARGAEGRGVLVIAERTAQGFVRANGEVLDASEMRHHIASTWSGLYSLGGRPDCVIVEERIELHEVFANLAVGGAPDVRIIVAGGRPVAAMVRFPTRASGGRANLFQGAVAAGIDLESGRTRGGVCRSRMVSRHPDTGAPLSGVAIPDWVSMCETARRLGDVVGLGYLGVDMVATRKRGPVVLEVNARPGLAIQIANRAGLRGVLGLT